MVKKQKPNKWKVIDPGIHGNAGDLISIEELVDYTAIRGKQTYSEPIEDDNDTSLKKKRRKKKRKNQNPQKHKTSDNVTEQPPAKKIKIDEKPSTDTITEGFEDPDMSAWNEFNLPDVIIKALAAKKFTKPTEIQVNDLFI